MVYDGYLKLTYVLARPWYGELLQVREKKMRVDENCPLGDVLVNINGKRHNGWCLVLVLSYD